MSEPERGKLNPCLRRRHHSGFAASARAHCRAPDYHNAPAWRDVTSAGRTSCRLALACQFLGVVAPAPDSSRTAVGDKRYARPSAVVVALVSSIGTICGDASPCHRRNDECDSGLSSTGINARACRPIAAAPWQLRRSPSPRSITRVIAPPTLAAAARRSVATPLMLAGRLSEEVHPAAAGGPATVAASREFGRQALRFGSSPSSTISVALKLRREGESHVVAVDWRGSASHSRVRDEGRWRAGRSFPSWATDRTRSNEALGNAPQACRRIPSGGRGDHRQRGGDGACGRVRTLARCGLTSIERPGGRAVAVGSGHVPSHTPTTAATSTATVAALPVAATMPPSPTAAPTPQIVAATPVDHLPDLTVPLAPPATEAPSMSATRDKLRQPFSSTSIWNMPIGAGARYAPAGFDVSGGGTTTIDTDYFFATTRRTGSGA